MIGTPGEHQDTPEINREYIEKLKPDMITLSTFVPLPGSPIWLEPYKYNSDILSYDYQRYNKDYWIQNNGTKAKREYIPLIHNKILSLQQMRGNVARMEYYIEETGRYNKG